ncbi:MAG: peptide chain release factor N(5)-glutamine methyltransferase [Lachnospiraceae bacterium]|nr:peptide chain release factor N(5)-glutamine methyltransferase [Lachnospiraceae bacterium]
MTLAEALHQGEEQLLNAGVPEAELNAWYLFAHFFQMERSRYFLFKDSAAEPDRQKAYETALAKRAERIPLEYITHETEFMGLPFYVDENVLIPRQDTECLVEEVLKKSWGREVLDLCTGSGCIGISLAALGNCHSVTMTDISEGALRVAERNARKNGVQVSLLRSDLFTSVEGTFDIIVSNPPYIPTAEVETLMPEVREHEPRLALDGAGDGLLFYNSIIKESGHFLRKGGWLFFEIGSGQGEAVSKRMRQAGFSEVEVKKDLAGLERIVCGCLQK